MPLQSQSPAVLHILQNLSLIILSACFTPLCTFIAILSSVISPFTAVAKQIRHIKKRRAASSSTFRPRTLLVTGVGTSTGLSLARTFHRAGHRVIGADFEAHGLPVCGRFSISLEKFYGLSDPSPTGKGSRKYVEDLVRIIRREKVDMWVSCSGVTSSAVWDGKAADAVQKLTDCKAVQFGATVTEMLHEKHLFIENTRKLGLNVPETHLITSVEEAIKYLYSNPIPVVSDSSDAPKKYIMKSVGLDDSIRADTTLLPRPSLPETKMHLLRLNPSKSRPFVLQQFISGPEYCTHSLIVEGRVKAFVVCRSAEPVMHYRGLPSSSLLSQAMFKYMQLYATKTCPSMTGHISLDFLLDETDGREKDLMKRIYAVKCHPRAHTAVVLFADDSQDLAEAYLSVLPDHPPPVPSNSKGHKPTAVTPSTVAGYYWMGHDLVALVILPFWDFALRKIDIWTFFASWVEFVEHVLLWRDGAFEVWDPWPAWWLYCVYWPGLFAVTLLTRRWWSSCNVSTTKMFKL